MRSYEHAVQQGRDVYVFSRRFVAGRRYGKLAGGMLSLSSPADLENIPSARSANNAIHVLT